jgi:hypothetical protein
MRQFHFLKNNVDNFHKWYNSFHFESISERDNKIYIILSHPPLLNINFQDHFKCRLANLLSYSLLNNLGSFLETDRFTVN